MESLRGITVILLGFKCQMIIEDCPNKKLYSTSEGLWMILGLEVEGSIRKLLKNANEIDDVLIAAVIRNLKIVNGGTKVIIMDANGIQSKKVARVLRKLGIKRSYRLQGGFQSWRADGLRIKQLKTETPLTILKEETEAILEEVKPTTGAIFLACVEDLPTLGYMEA
eukprot:Gb_41712 [translate_table: standard]